MPSDNILPFTPPAKFKHEFICSACGAHVFAAVHYGPTDRCLECKWTAERLNQPTGTKTMSDETNTEDNKPVVCDECQGTGGCLACGGIGQDDNENPCEDCEGSGECPACHGTGLAPADDTPSDPNSPSGEDLV